MSVVTVRVNAPVFGWAAGSVVEDLERTPMVDGAIANGYLSVLGDPYPARPSTAHPVPEVIAGPAATTGESAASAARAELSATVAVVPPRTGKGSGAEVWRAFLKDQGLDEDTVTSMDRDALIAAWDAERERRGL